MAQPPAYNRSYNFTEYAVANPSATYNASQHDTELNNVEATLDAINTNLALIQRDDGLLKNLSVHPDALSTATKALIGAGESGQLNWTPRGLWVTATAYVVGDVVEQTGVSYVAAVAHTSGTFSTDHTNGKWVTISQAVSVIAIADGSFTITGSADVTKIARFEVDTNIPTATTRVFTFPSASGTLVTLENAQTFTGKPTIDAALEIGGSDGADILTINTATITIGNNHTATRAAGALANSAVSILTNAVTCTADAGGSTDARAFVSTIAATGANAYTAATLRRDAATFGASGIITTGTVHDASVTISSTAAVTSLRVHSAAITLSSSGGSTTADYYVALAPTLSSTGAITTLNGFRAGNLGHATLVTTAVGFKCDDFTASATSSRGFQSSVTSGTGKFNAYFDGTADNVFAGNVRIGSTTAPTVALDVTGAFSCTGNATICDASADTMTLNAGTWTIGANYTATRAAGTLATGAQFLLNHSITFTGDAGGATTALPYTINMTHSGANALAGSQGFRLNTTHSGSGLVSSWVNVYNLTNLTSTGNITNADLFRSEPTLSAAGSVTGTLAHFRAGTPTLSSSGTVATMCGLVVNNQATSLVGTAIGVQVADMSAATTAMRGMQLELSAGTNKHNLYIIGSAENYIQGQVFLGSTTELTVGGASLTPQLQIIGLADNTASMVISRNSANANGGYLMFNKSRNGTPGSFTVVQDGDDLGSIYWFGDDGVDYISAAASITGEVDGTPGSNDMPGRLTFATTADGGTTTTERMRINSAGQIIIGSGTTSANANSTIGLTINQGSADNSLFCLKSSDVTHSMTTVTLGADVETDDFLTMQKYSATLGGLHMQVLAEAAATEGMMVDVWGGAPATTDTSASLGCINLFGGQHDGANADADMAANSNLLVVGEIDSSGARLTRMLLKADDGELHLGNTTLVALDGEDDVMAVRGLQMVRTRNAGVVPTEYDRPAYSYDKLRELGIVGERDGRGEFLIRVQPYLNLHDGAVWQLYVMNKRLEAKVAALEGRLLQ